jgi:gamma-glutamyltranspeptidase/glutathione hydrolase
MLRRSLLASLLIVAACDAHAPPPIPQATQTPAPPPSSSASADVEASDAGVVASAVPSADPYAPPAPPSPAITLHAGGTKAAHGNAAVATVETNATRVGVEVLRGGGNAVDAAVAVAFALAVTHPSAGNLGGGGFLIARSAAGETTTIDFREMSPASATQAKNDQQLKAGAFGYLSVAVPGTVAGLVLAREKLGTKPLAELVKPAIELARKGHKLGARQASVLSWNWDKLKHDGPAHAVWGDGKSPKKQGDLVKQPDLARTLEAIAKEGARGFYAGDVAQKIDRAMRKHGGLITADDLAAYEAKLRAPIVFSYRGFEVTTMPPPSMGGVALAEILLTLERERAWEAADGSALSLHLFIEASRRAYRERRWVGADPDGQPELATKLQELLSPKHLATRAPAIDHAKATPSTALGVAEAPEPESPQTTHFSIVDAQGNAVSCTYTQSAAFGSKVMIPGTGVLMNNAMGAFSGKGPNALGPRKRMASSMTPTIVTQNGKLALVLGSPGGDTIPNTVAQVLRNVVDYGMTIDEAVLRGRIHHQYLPDKLRVERAGAPPKSVLEELTKLGHTVEVQAMAIGDANEILFDAATGVAWAFADPREGGAAEGLDATSSRYEPPRPKR